MHNGMVFSLIKKERTPGTTWTDLENTTVREKNQSQKDKFCMRYLEQAISQTESTVAVTRSWGQGGVCIV